jgi:hypothetical protein
MIRAVPHARAVPQVAGSYATIAARTRAGFGQSLGLHHFSTLRRDETIAIPQPGPIGVVIFWTTPARHDKRALQ